ncbi:LPXTG cell wall anchor domain-containing protein [Weissella tructae]
MIMKNVLLASAALMGLGAVDTVNADETKSVDNKAAVVAAIEEVEAKNTLVFAAPAEADMDEEEIDDDEEVEDEEEIDEEEEVEDEEEVDNEEEVEDEEEFDEAYDAEIDEMNSRFEALQELADSLLEEDEVDVQEFLDAYFNDVVDLQAELLEFIEENGESEEAAELLDQLTAYLEEVQPTVEDIQALLEALENGDITDEEFDNKFFEVLGFVTEEDTKPEDKEDTKPEDKEDTKPEDKEDTKPEAKEDTKPEAKEDTKPEAKEDTKPEAKEDTKPEAKEDTKPEAKEDTKPEAKEDTKPEAKEDTKPEAKEDTKPEAKEDTKPEAKEDTKPEAKEDTNAVAPKAGVVAPKATEQRTQTETLPETGSDAKSFVSVIGALLAGLTVWGFGFKKRG